jgi:hypothetical protein
VISPLSSAAIPAASEKGEGASFLHDAMGGSLSEKGGWVLLLCVMSPFVPAFVHAQY